MGLLQNKAEQIKSEYLQTHFNPSGPYYKYLDDCVVSRLGVIIGDINKNFINGNSHFGKIDSLENLFLKHGEDDLPLNGKGLNLKELCFEVMLNINPVSEVQSEEYNSIFPSEYGGVRVFYKVVEDKINKPYHP